MRQKEFLKWLIVKLCFLSIMNIRKGYFMHVNTIHTPQTPNFSAVLVMPKNREVCQQAGAQCAKHLEKARPTIEKIAKVAEGIKEIVITPTSQTDVFSGVTSGQIKIGVLTEHGTSNIQIAEELASKQYQSFRQPFHKYIVDMVIDTIGNARLRDAVFMK